MSENLTENESSMAWNAGPIHLLEQMRRYPNVVLDDFFQLYSLPEIRSLVRLIFHHASSDNRLSNEQLSLLQSQLIRLIEAAWLLYTSDKENKEK